MKCLYYSQHFEEKNLPKIHYENKHKVNSANYYFKALFGQKKDKFFNRKCYRCESFLTSEREEKEHNFLNHYQKGGEIPLKNRPIIKRNDGTITKFEICYDDHKNSYDF